MKRFLKALARVPARMLINVGVLPRVVILCCNGGICSQMRFRLVGELLSRRGINVVYNIDWYTTNGKDLDGRFARNFNLLRMFPGLHFPVLENRFIGRLYHSLFYFHNNYYDKAFPYDWLKLRGPLWLDGYFRDPKEIFDEVFDTLFSVDTSILDAENQRMLGRIESAEAQAGACAIHVRRGDLARFNPAYGAPPTVDYFVNQYARLRHENPGTQFFIFSDEPDWCREQLLPKMAEVTKDSHGEALQDVTICDINGSDKGYYDLILMSRCRHIIGSQGSMGRYAARLRPKDRSHGTVILCRELSDKS